ncbi:MAG: hypothetical protein IT430_13070 [Phycisphaerales bacterium]|nr:hypothetical protein [Phycisphaerales bacterium]
MALRAQDAVLEDVARCGFANSRENSRPALTGRFSQLLQVQLFPRLSLSICTGIAGNPQPTGGFTGVRSRLDRGVDGSIKAIAMQCASLSATD